jgi:hypothetical protein
MKKYLNISFYYAIAALAGGVFYREFTKWNGFTGVTALGKVHAHLFLLGMFVFLLRRAVLIEVWNCPVSEELPCVSLSLYNIGVPLTGRHAARPWDYAGARDAALRRRGCGYLWRRRHWPHSDGCGPRVAAGVAQKSGEGLSIWKKIVPVFT